MGPLRNVKTVRVTDKAVLQAPMTILNADVNPIGKVVGSKTPAAYVINHNTENALATLRFQLKDIKISAAEDTFKVGDQQFNAGSFIIKTEGNPTELRGRLDTAVKYGLTVVGVDKLPEVKTHELAVPRIAILHTWTNTQNDGWYRIEFDRYRIPYTYISDQVVRNTPNLREKFDVIIFPPLGGSAQAIVNGIPMRGDPIPWKGSEVTPNMGLSPDQSDDIRGGMGLPGVANLQKFVRDGGLFITVANTTQVPIEYGLTTGVSIQETRQLQARGSIFNARFTDRKSPISYGYDETLPIYFNQAPVFQVAGGGGGGGGFGGGGGEGAGSGRPTGRGTLTDPDIVQAMPQASPAQRPAGPPGEPTADQRQQLGAFYVPPNERPRVILRFASDEKNLLISGMLAGGSELANAPAMIDVPVGKGHIVMFATNPMWRHQNHGSFFLIWNAALNFDSLNTERPAPAARRGADAASSDQ